MVLTHKFLTFLGSPIYGDCRELGLQLQKWCARKNIDTRHKGGGRVHAYKVKKLQDMRKAMVVKDTCWKWKLGECIKIKIKKDTKKEGEGE